MIAALVITLVAASPPAVDEVASIEAIAAGLARDYGVTVAWQPAQTVPRPQLEIDWGDRDDLGRLVEYLGWFDHEWRKYPPAFIRAAGLQELWFVELVDYGDGERTAYPGYDIEVLIYQFPTPDDGGLEEYYRSVVHHELFHMLEEEWNGDGYYHDPEWATVNPPDFVYDREIPEEELSEEADHPAHGFVSSYAMTAIEEDRAEVWSLMLTRTGWSKLDAWRSDDTILAAKVALLEAFARSHCAEIDAEWWRELRAGLR